MAQTIDLGLVRGSAGKDGVQPVRFELLFPASGWAEQEDGSFVQTAAADMTAADMAHIDLNMSAVTAQAYADIQAAWALVARGQTVDGGLTLTAFDGAPEADLEVKAEVLR